MESSPCRPSSLVYAPPSGLAPKQGSCRPSIQLSGLRGKRGARKARRRHEWGCWAADWIVDPSAAVGSPGSSGHHPSILTATLVFPSTLIHISDPPSPLVHTRAHSVRLPAEARLRLSPGTWRPRTQERRPRCAAMQSRPTVHPHHRVARRPDRQRTQSSTRPIETLRAVLARRSATAAHDMGSVASPWPFMQPRTPALGQSWQAWPCPDVNRMRRRVATA